MSKLNTIDCPGVEQKKIDAINELTDEQLEHQIKLGNASRFGSRLMAVLQVAQSKRNASKENEKRAEELEIARKANQIAEQALREAVIANKKSDHARLWSAIAVLVTVAIFVLNLVVGK